MGRKLGGSAHFLGRGGGPPSHTKSPGPRLTSIPSGMLIHPPIWPQQIWGENWGLCPFRGAGAGSPSNTMWPGQRPTCVPSLILIHPTVWGQCMNVIDRQTDRQRCDSIGRTVLQMVAQKRLKRSICCLGCGPKEAQVESYSPGGANVPTWEGSLAPPCEYD